MTVYCFGSINIDHTYRLPHLLAKGETLADIGFKSGLGGKGANQSVAAARAGAHVVHVGAIGRDGLFLLDLLQKDGIDVAGVKAVDTATGHAIVMVDPDGENAIVVHAGANRASSVEHLTAALGPMGRGDILLLQNETSLQPEAARLASIAGARVIYSAAPFCVEAVRAVLSDVSVLVMNTVEAAQLAEAMGGLPPVDTVITRGSAGAEFHLADHTAGSGPIFVSAPRVRAVDTTGAGDCFVGVLAAALDAGMEMNAAMRRAAAAGAIQVTRQGASAAMPKQSEIDALLEANAEST